MYRLARCSQQCLDNTFIPNIQTHVANKINYLVGSTVEVEFMEISGIYWIYRMC
jgi:hypothetical protein